MDHTVAERRADARHPGASLQLVHATLRPGCPVGVVDISETGVQVEVDRPLRPGTRVHLRLVSQQWTFNATALVLRCTVWAVHPEEGVVYRGALRFDTRGPAIAPD